MAQYGDQYGRPIRQTDEYGNPIKHAAGGATLGDYGAIGKYGADQYGTTGTTGALPTDPYGTTGTTGALPTDPYGTTGTTGASLTDPYGTTGTTGASQTDPYGTTGTTESYQNQYGATEATGGYGTQAASGGVAPAGITVVGLSRDPHYRRPGSSSSSSSEDDGLGGRRKKGLKEKMKESLPGVHHSTATPVGTTTGYGTGDYAATTATPVGTAGYGGDYGGHEHPHHEKKGIMDKIKEKLPGHHHHH